MGYFDGLVDGTFKKDKEGNTLFYPWGALGKGRLIKDEETRVRLRNFVKLYYQITLPVVILLSVFRLWILLAPAVIGLVAWFLIQTKSLLKDCPVSDEKLQIKEAYRNSAASHNKPTLWALLVVSLLMSSGGLWLIVLGKVLVGACSLVLFGLCSASFIYMLKTRRD